MVEEFRFCSKWSILNRRAIHPDFYDSCAVWRMIRVWKGESGSRDQAKAMTVVAGERWSFGPGSSSEKVKTERDWRLG